MYWLLNITGLGASGSEIMSPLLRATRSIQISRIAVFALVFTASCSPMIATYDHYAYTRAVDIKVEALHLMEQADELFELHLEEITMLDMKIEKAHEYEKGRPKNEVTMAMWEKFKSPENHLFGGFLKQWETKRMLKPAFIKESKKTVGTAIDQIIGLESGKIRKTNL